MAALPYMKFFVADYLADTQHLTTEEHGAYLLLLMNYWQSGKPLSNKNGELAKIVKLSPKRWMSVEPTLRKFFVVKRGIWKHERVDFDIQFVLAKSTKASFAGTRSGQIRANSRSKSGNERSTNASKRSTNVEQTLNHTDTDTDTDKRYSEFLEIYPRVANPEGTKKAFMKAIKKADPETILAGAKAYRDDPNRDPAYTKMSAPWLNQEYWLNGPLPKPKHVGEKLNVSTAIPKPFDPSEFAPRGGVIPPNIRESLRGATN